MRASFTPFIDALRATDADTCDVLVGHGSRYQAMLPLVITPGTATTATTTVPGENAARAFTATTGQKVSLTVSSNTIPGGIVSILAPDGTTLGAVYVATGTAFLDTVTLPVTGTYTVRVCRWSR